MEVERGQAGAVLCELKIHFRQKVMAQVQPRQLVPIDHHFFQNAIKPGQTAHFVIIEQQRAAL